MIEIKRHIIKNYCKDDFNNYLNFYAELIRLDTIGLHITPKLLAEDLNYPNRLPEKNLFIAWKNNKIIGFCQLIPEFEIGRSLMDILVHPNHRKQGIASELFCEASKRANAIGLNLIHVSIRETNEAAKCFLLRKGFNSIRRYHEMIVDLARLNLKPQGPAADPIRPLREGEDNRLTTIQNGCFGGSWGFNPNTVEEVCYLLNSHGSSYEDVWLACKENQPAAYCWTRIHKDPNTRINKGRIHMIGVLPGHRGKGLGKTILHAGLNRLHQQGAQVVNLTTDSKNESAIRLYRSSGFSLHWSVLWFEKMLPAI